MLLRSIFKPVSSKIWIVNAHHPDLINGVIEHINTKTSRQEPQNTGTRKFTLSQQECIIGSIPINHICNLDVALNNRNAPQTSPTTTDHHQPAAKHATQILTAMFQIAIQGNIFELTAIDHLYNQNPAILQSNLEFYLYDHSNLNAT